MIKHLTILLISTVVCFKAYSQQPPAHLDPLVSEVADETANTEAFLKKNIYVKVFASSQQVYAGEPVMVIYKLYASVYCRARVNKQPTFNNCSVLELDASAEPDMEMIEGKKFHVYTIRKVQVTPLDEGTLELGKMEVENEAQVVMHDQSIKSFSLITYNEPFHIHVLPLPVSGRPENFSGVVGSFIATASADSNNVPAGENATLKITIKGAGNFAGIHAPAIAWPAGTEHFEASDTQRLNQFEYPVSGYKIFSIPFIGTKEGSVEISPASFNFFDPLLKAYRTISTDKVMMTFTAPITTKAQMAEVKEVAGNSKYLWILAAIAAVVVCVLLISMQVKSSTQPMPVKETVAIEEQPVHKDDGVETLAALNYLGTIEDDKKFLAEASLFLTARLQDKLSDPDASSETLIMIIHKNNDGVELYKMCSNIYALCNRNLYALDTEEGIKEQVYFELSAVIRKLYPA